jgi:hypothetical protein
MDRMIENLTASPARKQTNEGRGKKIALLTVFDDNFREIAERTVPTMRRYAEAFDLEFFCMPPPVQDQPASWGKLPRIREVLQLGFDFCIYVDADAMFVRFDEDIRDHIAAEKHLYLCRFAPESCEPYNPVQEHYNSGVMLWRNCAWSIDFLDEMYRQTDLIHHPVWEQAALHRLLGIYSTYEGRADEPNASHLGHVQKLPLDWNVTVGRIVAADPIIMHVTRRSKALRLLMLDREIATQAIRELLPPQERHRLLRQMNLTAYHLKQAEDQLRESEERAHHRAEQVLAEHHALLGSRSRLAKALWRVLRRKLHSRV